MIFPGGRLRGRPASAPPSHAQVLWRSVPGGNVEAWLLPAAHAGPAPLVLFSHGNGELIDDWPAMLTRYRELGMHVLLPEYRSYGRSGGEPSERAVAEDAAWFVDAAAKVVEVDSSRVVLHGRSLGGGIVGRVLTDWRDQGRAPRGLILQSTFTSIPDVARKWRVPAHLIENRFPTVERLPAFDGPTLVLHGTEDALIPVAHGHALYRAARHGELHTWPGTHNTLPMHPTAYWPAVESFLRRAGV